MGNEEKRLLVIDKYMIMRRARHIEEHTQDEEFELEEKDIIEAFNKAGATAEIIQEFMRR